MNKLPPALNFSDLDISHTTQDKIQALEVMHHYVDQQKNSLKEQAELLEKQIITLHRRQQLAEKIFRARYNFEPLMYRKYALYELGNTTSLSLILPNEWNGACPFGTFVGFVQKLGDSTWEELVD